MCGSEATRVETTNWRPFFWGGGGGGLTKFEPSFMIYTAFRGGTLYKLKDCQNTPHGYICLFITSFGCEFKSTHCCHEQWIEI